MADPPPAETLFFATDIMEQGGGRKDRQLCAHLPANGQSILQNPFAMIRTVRAAFGHTKRMTDLFEPF
jgi:hypothetical protein